MRVSIGKIHKDKSAASFGTYYAHATLPIELKVSFRKFQEMYQAILYIDMHDGIYNYEVDEYFPSDLDPDHIIYNDKRLIETVESIMCDLQNDFAFISQSSSYCYDDDYYV